MRAGLSLVLPNDLICEEFSVTDYSAYFIPEDIIFRVEYEIIKSSPKKRVNEFITGRLCCRKALEKLNYFNFPVLQDHWGLPVFPETVVGSISHSHTQCMVILGETKNYTGIGIDVEELNRLKPSYLTIFCTGEELDMLKLFSDRQQLHFATLIFSAKESFYKLMFSMNKAKLNFKDMTCTITGNHKFSIRLLKELNNQYRLGSVFNGVYHLNNDSVYTAIYL
jgi:enterobactin synthetase component D